MNTTDISTLAISQISDLGSKALVVLTAVVGLVVAYYLYNLSMRMIKGTTVTGNAWLDRHLYKPYKGYNRWHSQKWNMEHTMN